MICIFCRQDSAGSVSVEHILPESLGNVEHVLSPGIVCDPCNNYFGAKVEGPLLDSGYFRYLRFWTATPSKRGRTPVVSAVHHPSGANLELVLDRDGDLGLFPADRNSERRWAEYAAASEHGQVWIPRPRLPADAKVARFLANVALEVLAARLSATEDGLRTVATEKQLDPLRNYARYGAGPAWPFHQRYIYPPDATFFDADGERFEVLHEFALHSTEDRELYLVCVIYGVEYAINLGGPEIDGYLEWLQAHEGKGPLELLPGVVAPHATG